MYKNKIFLLLLSSLFFIQIANTQNNTNSPFTRFGLGELSDNNAGEQRAMGGVAIGARSDKSINVVNPASYSSVDSMTFMFDVGASALVSRFSNPTGAKNTINANIEYVTMQFPLYKWLGFSAGVLPFSFSGYDFFTTEKQTVPSNTNIPDTLLYTKNFNGRGGISQIYGGLSAKFLNHISVGFNAYYMFGSLNNYRSVSANNNNQFTPTTYKNEITASNFRYRFGTQFYNTFNKKHDLTLGLYYEQKGDLKGNYSEISSSVLQDTINITGGNEFDLPSHLGVGMYYTYNNKISVGLDYSLQKWSDAKYIGQYNILNDRSKIALGVEYQPNERGRKFSEKIFYRAGFNTSNAYYNINGIMPPQNFGISFGLGLPLYNKVTNSTSMLNTTFEYGKIGSNTLLREDYFKLTLNVTFNEHWFFKRKL